MGDKMYVGYILKQMLYREYDRYIYIYTVKKYLVFLDLYSCGWQSRY